MNTIPGYKIAEYGSSGRKFSDDLTLVTGYFNFCVPLKTILEFAEDFNKAILHSKHQLILLCFKDVSQVLKSVITNEKFKLSTLNIK